VTVTDLAAAVAAHPAWYHTIELAPGVVTPGQVDLREVAAKVLPESLEGRRALDVGTFDGFWAFELERRGADTVAIDVDELDAAQWPPTNRERLTARAAEWDMELGTGFRIASEALGSKVQRIVCDVAELAPDRVPAPFDFVFMGAILLHLRDPVGALERVLSVLAPGGELTMLEPFSLPDTLRAPRRPLGRFMPLDSDFNWWLPNLSALKALPWSAGFEEVDRTGFHRPKAAAGGPLGGWHAAISARAPAAR
jgi:SAM-dependent methyltransferase